MGFYIVWVDILTDCVCFVQCDSVCIYSTERVLTVAVYLLTVTVCMFCSVWQYLSVTV